MQVTGINGQMEVEKNQMLHNINPFFIIGLPRTRSSWLSNFLTYKTSFCFHEAIRLCYKMEDMKDLFECVNEPNVGDADCRLLFYTNDMLRLFPNAKWVLINRKIEDVDKSLEKRYDFGDDKDKEHTREISRLINIFKKENKVLEFNFEDLDRKEVCKEIWEYCIKDTPFPEKRWYQLDVMKVDPFEDKMMKYHGEHPIRTVFDYTKNTVMEKI